MLHFSKKKYISLNSSYIKYLLFSNFRKSVLLVKHISKNLQNHLTKHFHLFLFSILFLELLKILSESSFCQGLVGSVTANMARNKMMCSEGDLACWDEMWRQKDNFVFLRGFCRWNSGFVLHLKTWMLSLRGLFQLLTSLPGSRSGGSRDSEMENLRYLVSEAEVQVTLASIQWKLLWHFSHPCAWPVS